MDKRVHSKVTYPLRVHQFTTPQVGKGGKRRKEFSLITQNSNMSMHKHLRSKATYLLKVYQFTTQEMGKGGKRMNHHTKSNLEYAQKCSFKRQLTP